MLLAGFDNRPQDVAYTKPLNPAQNNQELFHDRPQMSDYTKWAKDDLVKFATKRNIAIRSTAKPPGRSPTKLDYVTAIREADRLASTLGDSYHFPPELRLLIYQELLTMNDTWKCHPQILATSKQVRHEAITAYEDNGRRVIEVRMTADRVEVDGKPAGYEGPWRRHNSALWLSWPRFFTRAKHLRCVLTATGGPRHLGVDFKAKLINSALYSLCSYLRGSAHLRTVHLRADTDISMFDKRLKMQVWNPLQLLGSLESLKVEDTVKSRIFAITDQAWRAIDQLSGLRPNSLTCLDELRHELHSLRRVISVFSVDIKLHTVTSRAVAKLVQHADRYEHQTEVLTQYQHFCDRAWEEAVPKMLEVFTEALDRVETDKVVEMCANAYNAYRSVGLYMGALGF